MKTQEINYQCGDQEYRAFVANPEKESAPLILIAPSWAGRDDFVEKKLLNLQKRVMWQWQ